MKTAGCLPQPKKATELNALQEKIAHATAIVVTDYKGMTVAQISELRKKLRAGQVEYKVVKNTLLVKALQALKIDGLDAQVIGPIAVAFAKEDPIAPAKILTAYFDEAEKPQIKCGVVESKLLDAKDIAELAKLPSREELIAMVVGGLKSPLSGLVMVLSGLPRKLVYALDAVRKQKETKGGEQK
ncbi:MAG: 50S ribosomal protein L10 [Candidatus Margulisiibacteriota bacterium]